MMQNSNFKEKYLRQIWLAAAVVFIGAELFVRAFPMPSFVNANDILLDHHRNEIKNLRDGAIVFVGDSSLGNGVDAALLSSVLNVQAVNLATHGSWGTYADYFIVKEIVDSGIKPGAVCILHTTDQWNRGDIEMPILLAREFNMMSLKIAAFNVFEHLAMMRQSDIYSRFFMKFTDFSTAWIDLQKEIAISKALPKLLEEDHYVKQAERRDWERLEPRYNSPIFYVDERINQYLNKTIKLCQAHNIPVYLGSGPVWDKKAKRMELYNKRLMQWMKNKCRAFDGCQMLYEAIPTYPGRFIGDSDDHLTDEGRKIFTRWVAGFLRNAGAASLK